MSSLFSCTGGNFDEQRLSEMFSFISFKTEVVPEGLIVGFTDILRLQQDLHMWSKSLLVWCI